MCARVRGADLPVLIGSVFGRSWEVLALDSAPRLADVCVPEHFSGTRVTCYCLRCSTNTALTERRDVDSQIQNHVGSGLGLSSNTGKQYCEGNHQLPGIYFNKINTMGTNCSCVNHDWNKM